MLCGPMGSGKTSVGTELARRWGVTLRDSDRDVEVAAGRTVAEVFAESGEEAFRALEHAAVGRALAEHAGVLALGGGAVLHPRSRAALERYAGAGGAVVFLDVGADAVADRVLGDTTRPLLAGDARARWTEIAESRRPVYTALATHRVVTDGRTPAEVAALVEQAVQSDGPHTVPDGVPHDQFHDRPHDQPHDRPADGTATVSTPEDSP
ncbi:shikimate kinase [Cellulomonas marina]|nr:shikimate kinase [Cellulomonas marina]